MPTSSISRRERETTIIYNEAEGLAKLWTASKREAGKWLAAGLNVTTEEDGWSALAPKNQVQIRRPYTLSPEKLEAARARLVAARAKKAQKRPAPESLTNVNPSEPGASV